MLICLARGLVFQIFQTLHRGAAAGRRCSRLQILSFENGGLICLFGSLNRRVLFQNRCIFLLSVQQLLLAQRNGALDKADGFLRGVELFCFLLFGGNMLNFLIAFQADKFCFHNYFSYLINRYNSVTNQLS